jgi:hypothetical protein
LEASALRDEVEKTMLSGLELMELHGTPALAGGD